MRFPPSTLREWVVLAFGAIGVGLLPWSIWLSASLKPHHVTERWDLAWSGFDSGLAVIFMATAIAVYRRSSWSGAFAATTGTLLITDAWFDVVLESHAEAFRTSIMLAVFAELPLAALCYWIAYRTERLLAQVVDQALHLAAPGERPPEGDLIGVFQVASDRQPARKPGDPDPTA